MKVIGFMLLVGDWRNKTASKDAKMYDFNNQVSLLIYINCQTVSREHIWGKPWKDTVSHNIRHTVGVLHPLF